MQAVAWYPWVAGVVLPLVLLFMKYALDKLDKRNTLQHADAMAARERIERKIDATHDLLVEHIVWHGQNPPTQKDAA